MQPDARDILCCGSCPYWYKHFYYRIHFLVWGEDSLSYYFPLFLLTSNVFLWNLWLSLFIKASSLYKQIGKVVGIYIIVWEGHSKILFMRTGSRKKVGTLVKVSFDLINVYSKLKFTFTHAIWHLTIKKNEKIIFCI